MGKIMGEAQGLSSINWDDIVKVDIPDEGKLQYTTQCCCVMYSYFLEMPACLSINEQVGCLCQEGSAGFGCCQCTDDTKACSSGVSGQQCCDSIGGRQQMILLESGAAFVQLFCTKGAMKSKMDCTCRPIFSKQQSLCCDSRCACPPTEDTVPFGISCCGFMITGTG